MQKIPKIGLISLGCAKNLVDAERLSSALIAKGYEIAPDYQDSDLVVVNTCGFINSAQDESYQAIDDALKHCDKVVVAGCLGTKKDEILKHFPNVFAIYGPSMRTAILRGIAHAVGEPPYEARQRVRASGVKFTPKHYSYVKIAEGCRHHCSFCIIPSLRGPLRSRELSAIISECEDLVKAGSKELLIIAQDSSDYGIDLKTKSSLSELCEELSKLNVWLRLHYVYPNNEANRVVELMSEHKVLPYLDVPFQHANQRILKLMRRPHNIQKVLNTINNWRNICPDIAIRSTFITGFPGETTSEFNELLDFIKEAKLDRVGCFPYSDVEGAEANSLDNPVDPEIRQERAELLMQTQEQISYEKLQQRIGKEYVVIVDDVTEDGLAICRSKYEAPDVDGVITIENAQHLRAGNFVNAIITGASTHDMTAKLCTPGQNLNNISFKNK